MDSNSDPLDPQCAGAANTSNSSGYYAVPGQEDAPVSADFSTTDSYAAESESPAPAQTIAALLGGAGVGAMLMYLLDPEEGPQRRNSLSHYAHGAWDTLRDKATEYGASAYDGAGRVKDRIAHSGLGEEAYDRARYLVRGRDSRPGIDSGTGQLFAGLGILAAGVGAMYYFDPQRGSARRNECSQKIQSAFTRMFRSLDGLGKDLWNRTQGLAHEARASATSGSEQVDDRVLQERVRAEIGRILPSSGTVNVVANNGTVTVSGFVNPADHDPLLKSIWGVRGVQQLVNRLDLSQRQSPLAVPAHTAAVCSPEVGSTFANPT